MDELKRVLDFGFDIEDSQGNFRDEDDYPRGHPMYTPTKFFDWLMQIAEELKKNDTDCVLNSHIDALNMYRKCALVRKLESDIICDIELYEIGWTEEGVMLTEEKREDLKKTIDNDIYKRKKMYQDLLQYETMRSFFKDRQMSLDMMDDMDFNAPISTIIQKFLDYKISRDMSVLNIH